MESKESLQRLLIDFFDLPETTRRQDLRQGDIAAWDSLAMVQLITELQGAFAVEFDLDEIEFLRSYEEIRASLVRKGISLGAE